MTEQSQPLSAEQAVGPVSAYVVDQLKRGVQRGRIIESLGEMGVDKPRAEQLIASVQEEVDNVRRSEQFTPAAMVSAGVAALATAALCGLAWGWIMQRTGYEFAMVSWAIGLACGTAVALGARGARGTPLQAVAVVASVLGIIAGKYYGLFLASDGGGLFSRVMFDQFAESLSTNFGVFGLIFLALAVVTAWQIPKASRLVR